jgi:hypothetical protein
MEDSPVSHFDTTGRRTAKRNPVGFFDWHVPQFVAAVPFTRWLDARTVPAPPEGELTCDALAEFLDPNHSEAPWILVSEFQTEPREDDLERVVEYAIRFRRERRPESDPRLKYLVGGLILNLTGPEQSDSLSMALPGIPEIGITLRVKRVAVREQDARATLARIAAGELDRCVLPWVSLMKGGGESDTIEEWKRLADLEPNPRIRLEYAADALVFADLPDVRGVWKKALEGWNVRVSQQVQEWQNEAAVKTQQSNVLRLLEKRCKAPVPRDLATLIEKTQDIHQLEALVDAAALANTFDDFRSAIQP